MGTSRVQILSVTRFLFIGNRLHSASLTFPEFQRAELTVANQGREGMRKQMRSSQETIVQPGRGGGVGGVGEQVLVPLPSPTQGIYLTIPLSLSVGTKRMEVEDGNFRLSTRLFFLFYYIFIFGCVGSLLLCVGFL